MDSSLLGSQPYVELILFISTFVDWANALVLLAAPPR